MALSRGSVDAEDVPCLWPMQTAAAFLVLLSGLRDLRTLRF